MVTAEEMQKAAATIIAGIGNAAAPSLSSREFAEFILAFANGKRGDALTGPLSAAPDVLALPALPSTDRVTGRVIESRRTQFIESHRAELRGHLALTMGRKALPPETFGALSRAALQMIDPVSGYEFKRTTKGAKQRYLHTSRFYIPLKLSAILAHGVLMLGDERLGLGEALKRCALPSCNAFFLTPESPRGRPKLFCGPAHMEEKHRATGPERTRKWRRSSPKPKAKQ